MNPHLESHSLESIANIAPEYVFAKHYNGLKVTRLDGYAVVLDSSNVHIVANGGALLHFSKMSDLERALCHQLARFMVAYPKGIPVIQPKLIELIPQPKARPADMHWVPKETWERYHGISTQKDLPGMQTKGK